MNASLDGQSLFDRRQLKIELGSFSRDSIERAVPGLDGVLSVDMGGRGRKIKQRGVLQAKGRTQMDERIIAISAYMDGDTHTLVTGSGEEYGNLRMDVFNISKERADGSGVVIDYEIIYTQLRIEQ
jgi:hypothetical protein